jgi:hypothetical protein
MDLKDTLYEIVDWIHLTANRDQWRDFVNTLMNLRAPYRTQNSWPAEQLSAPQIKRTILYGFDYFTVWDVLALSYVYVRLYKR